MTDPHPGHPLSPQRTERRRAAVRAAVAEQYGPDAVILVGQPANIAHLTGFTGSNGMLALGAGEAVLATDFRYLQQARRQAPDVDLVEQRDVLAAALGIADGDRPVVLESEHLSAAQWFRAADIVGADRMRASSGIVERLRRVKDDAEVAAVRAACTLAQQALIDTLDGVAVGVTERDVAALLEYAMRTRGAHAIGFPTIVAAGENSAVPHHAPSDRPLAAGDLLKIDFGAVIDGYHSDMTRTFVVGAEPADWQAEVHALVASAQRAGAAAVRAGADLGAVDAAAREVIAAAGHSEHFGHGLGHGVGLQIHEWPILTPRAAGTLEAGMTITVEPGVYLPGRGGVRIEDTVVVTDAGAHPLTDLSRDLVRVG